MKIYSCGHKADEFKPLAKTKTHPKYEFLEEPCPDCKQIYKETEKRLGDFYARLKKHS